MILTNLKIEEAKKNLGKKSCIVLNEYTNQFFEARYSTDSYACRRARVNIP